MSHQIAVRVPDALLEFINGEVHSGQAPSRAAVVLRALHRDRRRRLMEMEVAVFDKWKAEHPDDADDLDGLAEWAAKQPLDLD